MLISGKSKRDPNRESGWDLLKKHVIDTDMCCGCGGCVGTCPVDALEINPATSYLPTLIEEKCIHCPLCYDVCPGPGYPVIEMSKHNSARYNKTEVEIDPVRGAEIGHVLGWSTDITQQEQGASGGMATAIMQHCIEAGIADQALVAVMRNQVPTSLLTDDLDEIAKARGSIYTPTPMMDIIDEVRRKPRKIAIIGSGCHLASWEMAAKRHKQIRDSVVLSMGFFCGGVQSVDALKAIASGLGVKYPEEVEFIGLREGHFPGNARFRHRITGKIYDMPLYTALDIVVPYFTLNRCQLCPDNSALLADLVLGDHHHSKEDDTAITVRTERGREILDSARRAGKVHFREMEELDVKQGTVNQILSSRVYPALSKIDYLKEKKEVFPKFDLDHAEMFRRNPQYKKLRFIWILKYRLIGYLSTGWRVNKIKKYPALMQRLGHFLYYLPSTFPGYILLAKLRRKILDFLSVRKAKKA